MSDSLERLREEGYSVDVAVPARDDAPAIYVVERGELVNGPDPAVPADYVLSYGTVESLADSPLLGAGAGT